MDKELEILKKVEEMHSLLFSSAYGSLQQTSPRRESELERAIREAIDDLDKTKSSFKSQQIMTIKEKLQRAVERKQ